MFTAQLSKGHACLQGLMNIIGFGLMTGSDPMRAAGDDGVEGMHNWLRVC